VLVVSAALADAEAILALQRLAYQSEARLYDDWSIPPLTQTLEETRTELARMTVLKACDGEVVVGSVRAVVQDGVCSIGRLIVHPEYQGRGIGTRLMLAIESAFPKAATFELFTGSKSLRTIRLYERLGYATVRTERWSEKLSLVFMRKAGSG
jgi:ribosomal protein S18 acetylase RimI-like enzyme